MPKIGKMRCEMAQENIIGIISDSHDNRDAIHRAVDVFNSAECALVIHGGDYVAPFTVREFGRLECPLVGVYGNNDGERAGLEAQYANVGQLHRAPHEFGHGGKRFIVMHEPYYLDDSSAREDVDVVVYGHTHKIDIRPGKPLVINPGESCSWLSGRSTVVLLDIETMKPQLIDLYETACQ